MPKNNQAMFWIIGILALIGIGMYIQNKYEIFSILPTGQYTANTDCTFITNVDSLETRYSGYQNTGIWISTNLPSTGMASFGYKSKGEGYGQRAGCCGGGTLSNYNLLIEDINSAGDDIYFYRFSNANLADICICSANGYYFSHLYQNYGSASSAVTSCGTDQFSCSIVGQKICIDTTKYKECLANLQLSGLKYCSAGTSCTNGECSATCTPNCACASSTCTTSTCSNGCGGTCPGTKTCTTPPVCVTLTELTAYANQWVAGSITFSQLITYANSWVSC